MTNFFALFCLSVLVNVAVTLRSTGLYKIVLDKIGYGDDSTSKTSPPQEGEVEKAKEHKDLLKRYLLVYLLATMSDWLQGPYVYALYSDYGYSQHDIAILFVAGFGSSMIFGSFVGSMADWGGRRTFVVLYTVFYALSCMTKHFQSFWILMIGRLLGGVATSLLFSVFEAWLIRAHNDAKLKQYLGKSFSWAAYGNSIIAILAGLVANNAASSFPMSKISGNMYYGGYLNPFDISLVALAVCAACAFTMWEENYGQENENDKNGADYSKAINNVQWYNGIQEAFNLTMRKNEILFCGIISSLFEGSMYIFVFMWTPALTGGDADVKLPFGLIFSTFMVCCMVGSSLFSILMDMQIKVESLAVALFGLASFSLFIVATVSSPTLSFIAMNIFEVAVGLYWPAMGTMKGAIVPESKRAAIYNLFRIPLNFIVLFSLLTDLSPTTSFYLCGSMLAVATGLQWALRERRVANGGVKSEAKETAASGEEEEMLVSLKAAEGGAAEPKDSDV